MTVSDYIVKNWPLCFRENKDDDGTLIGLPYPYTVPSIENNFQEMYYWDTYFINHGLIMIGHIKQAINNVENMFSLIERFGFMPNGNRTYYLKNSQPPFLSLMVRDIYEVTGDKEWLKRALFYLKKEYSFWQQTHKTETELLQYRGDFESAIERRHFEGLIKRIKKRPEGIADDILSINYKIACESGWDISPRFEFEAQNFVQVDLNSLMYAMEKNIAFFSEELCEDAEEWNKLAEIRLSLMNKYMARDGVFYDYNFKTQRTSSLFSCACLYPLWLGLLNEQQAEATVKAMCKIEAPYGLYAAEKIETDYTFQWGYPNGWAPLHQIAISGLIRYGYTEKALNLAEKYVALVEKTFEETGTLWEKYNVFEGNIKVAQERDHAKMPAMLGWSAGVYLYAKDIAQSL